MAFSQSDLDNLDAAIKSGALRVEVAGRNITYRSLAEMQRTRGEISVALNAAAGKPVRRRVLQAVSQKGW